MSYITRSSELDAVYSVLQKTRSRSIAITSAFPNEGVTTLVTALAKRILMSGHTVLVVDFNTFRPAFQHMLALPSSQENVLTPALITDQSNHLAITGVCVPESKSLRHKIKRADVLQEMLEAWLSDYDYVLFDTTPIKQVNQQNISCLNVANVCDGTIIVVLSGYTSLSTLAELKEQLISKGATILGCVLNDKDYPKLKDEILKRVDSLPNYASWARKFLTKIIKTNHLLKMDV